MFFLQSTLFCLASCRNENNSSSFPTWNDLKQKFATILHTGWMIQNFIPRQKNSSLSEKETQEERTTFYNSSDDLARINQFVTIYSPAGNFFSVKIIFISVFCFMQNHSGLFPHLLFMDTHIYNAIYNHFRLKIPLLSSAEHRVSCMIVRKQHVFALS